MLWETAFLVLHHNRGLSQCLSLNDTANLAMSAKCLTNFREQLPVQIIKGASCGSLKSLYKYLKRCRAHVHAKLFVDEIVDIEQYLCPSLVETLLLQPCVLNWNPYAILRRVDFLENFAVLKHLEVSLNAEGAHAFTGLLRLHLRKLEALVVSTTEPVSGFWSGLAHQSRPGLVSVSVNNFLLEAVPLGNIGGLRFLWISRPVRKRDHAAFLRRLCHDVCTLTYLGTVDFKGFSKPSELEAWLRCLEGASLPALRYWEVEGSDVVDIPEMARCLVLRRIPLTIQGLRMREARVLVDPGHRLLSGIRDVSLHNPRIYRSLAVLEHVVQTSIPTNRGLVYLRGRAV
jgi:hypothetical protein